MSADAADDAADGVAVERPAMIGDEPVVLTDHLDVVGGPAGEQADEFGVQWHVTVVAELAERDAQPLVRSLIRTIDIGGEVAEFAGA